MTHKQFRKFLGLLSQTGIVAYIKRIHNKRFEVMEQFEIKNCFRNRISAKRVIIKRNKDRFISYPELFKELQTLNINSLWKTAKKKDRKGKVKKKTKNKSNLKSRGQALKNKNNSPKNRKRQNNQQKQPALQE